MKSIYRCGSCLLRRAQDGLCSRGGQVVQESEEACRWYVGEQHTATCELCGSVIESRSAVVYPEDTVHITCGQCAGKMGSCATCIRVKECAFETDPSPIPQVVQKRIQQGPMTQIVQVMNPDRIAITCKMGCACWDNEAEACNKQTCGTCGTYTIIWEDGTDD